MNPKFHETMFGTGACILAFDRYKKTKTLPVGAPVLYDVFLEKLNVKTLCGDPETRKKLIAEGIEKHTALMLNLKNDEEMKGNFQWSEDIIASVANEFKGDLGFQRTMKGEFLRHYFNELIANGKELEL